MSKYTTELRFICEHSAGLTESVGYASIDEVLDKSRDKIFDFDFPMFDESYRNVLENKILKHYYTREICCETVGRWKLFLNTKLNEIMPYYNQLYKSAVIEFNPMYDVDLTTNYQKVDNGNRGKTGNFTENDSGSKNSSGTSTRTDSVSGNTTVNNARKNDHWEYFSDTPEGGINGVENLSYLTNATHVTDDGTGSTSSTVTTNNTTSNGSTTDATTTSNEKSGNNSSNEVIRNTEDYLHHIVGKTSGVSYSKLLNEYRDTFINIDMMIIKDLRDLFMNIW